MKLWKLTKRQVIIRLSLLAILLVGGVILLMLRACPKWHDQRLMPPEANGEGGTQETVIVPPEGYTRIPAAEDSFLAFMREMPVWEQGSSIMTYDGKAISSVNAAAIYTLSLPDNHYQQCADTVIRLWSEYFYQTGQFDRMAFTFTSGYQTRWTDWQNGWRYLTIPVVGKTFRLKLASRDDSLQQMHNYLQAVMQYAGTLSLEAESHPISAAEARAGDIICKGGTPGHVLVIVDEAVNEAGERCFLLAQGLIPAQSAHIITGCGNAQSPWYTEEQLSERPLRLSSYTYQSTDVLRRWKEGFPNAAETHKGE